MTSRPSPARARVLRAILDGHTTAQAIRSSCRMEAANVRSHLDYARSLGLVEVVGTQPHQYSEPWNRSRRVALAQVWGLTSKGKAEIEA